MQVPRTDEGVAKMPSNAEKIEIGGFLGGVVARVYIDRVEMAHPPLYI